MTSLLQHCRRDNQRQVGRQCDQQINLSLAPTLIHPHLTEHDVGIDYQVVTLLVVKLGMLGIPDFGQDAFETWEIPTQMACFVSTRDIVPDITFPQDWMSVEPEVVDLQLRTFPLAVFFRNLC